MFQLVEVGKRHGHTFAIALLLNTLVCTMLGTPEKNIQHILDIDTSVRLKIDSC